MYTNVHQEMQSSFLLFSGADVEHATEAMHAIAESVTQCKFEATDPAADEVVLYKILQASLRQAVFWTLATQ